MQSPVKQQHSNPLTPYLFKRQPAQRVAVLFQAEQFEELHDGGGGQVRGGRATACGGGGGGGELRAGRRDGGRLLMLLLLWGYVMCWHQQLLAGVAVDTISSKC